MNRRTKEYGQSLSGVLAAEVSNVVLLTFSEWPQK